MSEGATMSEWTQQRRDDYADGYEFARNEMSPDYKAAYAAAARANHAFIESGDTDEAKRVSDITFAVIRAAYGGEDR